LARLTRVTFRLTAALVALLGVGAVVLLLLTQTQVGRDQVARQVEAQFAQQFEGTVSIGRLSGNLVWDLYGSGVEVRDPQGRVVLSADSVILQPRWTSLFSSRLELRRVTLIRPRIELVHEESGWNLATAFAGRHAPRLDDGRPLDLSAAAIRIVDGFVITRNEAHLPDAVASGAIFDYTSASLDQLNARLAIDFRGADRRLRIRSLSGHLSEGELHVRDLRGLLQFGDDRLAVDGARLRLTDSSLEGSGQYHAASGALRSTFTAANLDPRELRHLVPQYPLAAPVRVAGRLSGYSHDLTVHRLALASGESQVRLAGTVAGLPQAARFDVRAETAGAVGSDIDALLALADAPLAQLGTVRGTADASGGIALGGNGRWHVESAVDLSSDAGDVRGAIDLSRQPGAPLAYHVDAVVRNLNPARLADGAPAGSVAGRLTIDGRGLTRDGARLEAGVALGPSRLADRSWDALAGTFTLADGQLVGRAAMQTAGRLTVDATADLNLGSYDVTLTAEELDLRALLPAAPPTSLTGEAALTARGASLDGLVADLDFQLRNATATVADSTWHLPEDAVHVAVRPAGDSNARFHLSTEALSIRAGGTFDWSHVIALGEQWGDHVAETVRRDLLPSMRQPPAGPPTAARQRGAPRPDQHVQLAVTAHAHHALRPWIADLAPGSLIFADAHIGSDSLRLQFSADAPEIRIGTVRMAGARGDISLAAADGADLLARLALDADVRADTLVVNGGAPIRPELLLDYDPRERALGLRAHSLRASDSLFVSADARVAVLADRFRLGGTFALDSPSERWHAPATEIDVFTDGFIFHQFDASRLWPDNGAQPHLRLAGTASGETSDTLRVVASELSVNEVLELLDLPLPFDGRAAADLLVTSALRSPSILGDAEVRDFTIWGDPSGTLVARSEIVPGRDGFEVDLRVRPDSAAAPIRNDFRLAGAVRFPGAHPDGSRDRGLLDLETSIDRLDLFIFNHLFPDIVAGSTGGADGSGSITGDWSYPVFEADLRIRDGHARVPAFNLELDATGRVTVDRRGIHLHNVRLADKLDGTGRVDGGILFNDYRFFSFDLLASMDRFEVIDVNRAQAGTLPFYGHVRASGAASLTGPLHNAFLRSPDAVTTPDSRLYIPVTASGPAADFGFLTFADADGRVPEPEVRQSLIAERPETERPFLDGLQMLLNVDAPAGSTVHLVFDPIIGDQINAVGSGRLQLSIREGEFQTFGTFEVDRGDYLFTAGDVFTRRFELERGGTLEWDGDPIDARLDLPATYRTRASLAGLGLAGVDERQRVPFIVRLDVGGYVSTPLVELSLELDEGGGRAMPASEALRRRLNEPDRQAEYATSVLLTNTFLLAPSDGSSGFAEAADELLFTSLSELVSTRVNLFLNQALGADNLDIALGVQQGVGQQDFDLTYGVALRLLDERLVIRGEGVYQQMETRAVSEAFQGEVVVEVRVSDAVSVEVFYRREGELLLGGGIASAPTGSYGAGVNYQTEFSSWGTLLRRLTGAGTEDDEPEPPARPAGAVAGG
jgi:translocation and assembly module TamB